MSGENEEHPEYLERRHTLTPGDLQAIADMMRTQHTCRFSNVTPEDMDFVKDLLSLYKETRSEILKWFIRGVVMFVIAVSTLIAWLKYSGKV